MRKVNVFKNAALRRTSFFKTLVVGATTFVASQAGAAQTLRVQVDQRGDFIAIGNTLGHDCGGAATPIVGTANNCGNSTSDSSPDVFWTTDGTADGTVANQNVTLAQATSIAQLNIPAGATVSHAYLYWAGQADDPDTKATLKAPSGASAEVTAVSSYTQTRDSIDYYQSVADVTALVALGGSGQYQVSGVDTRNLVGYNQEVTFAAWTLVVFYQLDTEPPRNLALFDGFDIVATGANVDVTINGFLVPPAGFDAKLGVIAYEGDSAYSGDKLFFNAPNYTDANRLSHLANSAGNFFSGSRTYLGSAVSNVGDLPQLSGALGSMSSYDLHVVDVTNRLSAGDEQATIRAATSQDVYFLGAFVTSISTFKPDYTKSTKQVTDLNGGNLVPGDELEYTITVKNTGNDASIFTVLNDTLPAGVTYVSGSLSVDGATKTDGAGDDEAEYDAASSTLTVRLGDGASSTEGGKLEIDETAVVKFRVTVDLDATGTISNQAEITFEGDQGAPETTQPTDGDAAPGSQSTNIGIDRDNDGLTDDEEALIGTDPDDADSDDDGVLDGDEIDPAGDADGDGLINALDPDSDNDGLFDGTEMGYDCSHPATDLSKGACRADADPSTTTDPLNWDTDGGGASDGSEDWNLDGKVDPGETDPTAGNGADDASVVDTDGDGLGDKLEEFLGSDPNDSDSDDDGVPDGQEPNPSHDTDGDGLINVLDRDSDNDGLYDGTEMGLDCSNPGTASKPDGSFPHCIADGDSGATTTSPLLWDTDGGGVSDGSEDWNRNGVVDPGETDPTLGNHADDASVVDSDGDGLSDDFENAIGTDPNNADSDNDGLLDGEEPNPADDQDGDGLINALDPDSDNDGLFDGLEAGKDCSHPDTDTAAGVCTPDEDNGATTTGVLNPDTDRGGVTDGDEDTNKNGAVDPGERDPNDGSDDIPGGTGGTGGTGGSAGSNSGGTGNTTGGTGNSTGGTGNSTGGTSTSTGGTAQDNSGFALEGGGCSCQVPSGGSSPAPLGLALGALGLMALRRRRRQ